MNLNAVWVCCTLMLLNLAEGCKWMGPRDKGSLSYFKVLSNYSILLLEQMGDEITLRKSNVHILNRFYDHATNLQAEERIIFIHEVINDIKKMYINGKFDTVTWDPKKLQMFRFNLDRQASELQECVKALKSRASHHSWFKKMKIYFKKMLRESTNYSSEHWEKVRADVLTHLRRLDILGSMGK